jgi:hypothetical protein
MVEELVGILGFSLGASVGVSAARSVADGGRPVLRDVVKAGIRVWDAAAGLSTAVRQEVSAAAKEAKAPRGARPRRRRAEPQKIAIARG